MTDIRCVDCGLPYPLDSLPHVCPKCGGLFDYAAPPAFSPAVEENQLRGLWKYLHTFSIPQPVPIVSLGEGATPLVWDDYRGTPVGLKMESLNPTGSYKDRGSAVLVSHLVSRGIGLAVEDSSGNAGASFAAYAARVGIKARVYVPESSSGPKRTQIEMYGAELVRVAGPRSVAAQAVLEDVQRGAPYASHAYLPFGLEGIATIAYELWEDLKGQNPGTVIAPVGHGGLLLGLVRGFKAIQTAGYSQNVPYYVGVQSAACDPIVRGFNSGIEAMESASEGATLAEGTRVRHPVRAKALIQEIARTQGSFVSISEPEILSAFLELGRRGHYVEPTSAMVWTALEKINLDNLPRPIIMVLSGFGLKYKSEKY